MKYIWRLINVWYWKESIRGTAVSVLKWTPKTDMNFADKSEKIMDESSIWQIASSKNAFQIKEWAEGTISHNIWIESIALPLLALMWNVTSSAASAGAYNHSFTLDNTNQHQSLTIGVKDPVVDLQFSLAMIESITISAAVGQFATVSIDYKSKKSEAATQTVTNTVDYELLARNGIFKLADNLAGLDAALSKCIQSFEITITKNVEEVMCLWSIAPSDYVNKQFSVEGSFVAVFENEADYKDVTFGDTTKALRLQLIDSNTTIWASDNPTLTIDLPKATFNEWEKTQGNDEIVSQTVTFSGHYSIADSSILDIDLINETASY